MTNTLNFHFRTNRFRPLSLKHFNTCAKHLSKITGDGYLRSRETLARVYGYANAQELHAVLEQPGIPGPFEDVIPIDEFNTEKIRVAINDRNAHALHLILEANQTRYDKGAAKPNLLQIYMLQLFSTPKAHAHGFRDLNLPTMTSAERRREREKYADHPTEAFTPEEPKPSRGLTGSNKALEEKVKPAESYPFRASAKPVVVKRKRPKQIVKPYDVAEDVDLHPVLRRKTP